MDSRPSAIRPDPGGYESGTIRYSYDNNGNVLSKMVPAQNQTNPASTVTINYNYDALNRLQSKTYTDGTPTAQYNYDAPSTMIGSTQVQASNYKGRLTSEVTQSTSTLTQSAFTYDPMGRVTGIWSCSLVGDCSTVNSVSYLFDFLGNETDRNFNGVDWKPGTGGYDTVGRLTNFTQTTFTDANNPQNLLSSVSYDPMGHMTFASLGNGLSESWQYDKRGRLTSMAVGTGCSSGTCTTPTYSLGVSYYPNGDVQASNDSVNGSWVYTYDDFNRLASMSPPGGAANLLLFSEQFDRSVWIKNRATVTAVHAPNPYQALTAERLQLSPTYGLIRQLPANSSPTATYVFSVWLKSNTTATQSVAVEFQLNFLGTSGGAATTCSVGQSWQQCSVTGTIGGGATIANQTTGSEDILAWGAQLQLGSSPGSYVATEGLAASPYTFAYDRYGNRWQQNGPNTYLATFSSGNNRLDGFSYDASGNLLNDGHNYLYDAENHLVSVDGAWTYSYDAEGRRVQRTVSSGTPYQYFYGRDGNPLLAAYLNTSPANGYREIYVAGTHLATQRIVNSVTKTFFDHADWLQTERAVTDVTGALCETSSSLPFGDGLYENLICNSGGDISLMHFTGDEHDNETKLDHTQFRQLSSVQGRWLSPDPAGMAAVDLTNPQTLNLYSYLSNDPLNDTDPSGLFGGGCGGDIGYRCGSPALIGGCASLYGAYTAPCAAANDCEIDGTIGPCSLLVSSDSYVACPASGCQGYGTHWDVTQDGHYLINVGSTTTASIGRDGTLTFHMEDSWKEVEFVTAGVDPVALEGIGGEILSLAQRGISRELLEEAVERYPRLADLWHDHHVISKYLGGAKGPISRIPAAYHQLITNAIRELAPYGKSAALTAERIKKILIEVYTTYPLPK